ncbi:MAG TPA: SURF1 family cytochrome oxidase biogenesis protein [Oligoflexia bacterium]|nr:SURF1 family cytochrome oxidase biogenesis protein [Oligoflexia bacterium]HMP47251.1 SURF1 family cytochrome oxidase biogenesis protein [Oligoflexia bacterium]
MKIRIFFERHFSPKISLFAIFLAIIMLTASRWQWVRYREKIELEEQLRSLSDKSVISIVDLIRNNPPKPYTKVKVTGKYDLQNQHIIINRRHKFGSGSWLITPIKIEGIDEHILISRGFIPYSERTVDDWKKYDENGEIEVFGVTQNSIGKRSSLSPSAKTPHENRWLYPDLQLMQKAFPYSINKEFFLQRLGHGMVKDFPAEDISIDVPSSTHFWYTFEWIILAITTLVVAFLIQLFRPRKV